MKYRERLWPPSARLQAVNLMSASDPLGGESPWVRRALFVLLAVVVAAFPLRAFYPYELAWPILANGAERLVSGGVVFTAPGVAVMRAGNVSRPARTLQVRLQVQPARTETDGPGRILSHGQAFWLRNLAVIQRGSDLVVMVRTHYNDLPGRGIVVSDVFASGNAVDIVVAIEGRDLMVSADGRAPVRFRMPSTLEDSWVQGARLRLGNEGDLSRPWLGRVTRAQWEADGEPIDLLAEDVLEIPRPMQRFHNPPEWIPFSHAQSFDVLQNLLGFIPLGFVAGLLWLGRARHAFARIVIGGALLSLFIETAQWLMPARFISVSDWLLNTAGTALGAGLAAVFLVWWSSRRDVGQADGADGQQTRG